MMNLNYLIDHILYQIFTIILSIFKKKRGEKIDSSSLQIYVNKIENIITFKIRTDTVLNFERLKQWNYLEALKTR